MGYAKLVQTCKCPRNHIQVLRKRINKSVCCRNQVRKVASSEGGYAPVLLWFRRDLRVQDHPGLQICLQQSPVVPLVTLDENLYGFMRSWKNGDVILKHSILQLKKQLLQLRSNLAILHGDAKENLKNLILSHRITHIVTEVEIEEKWVALMREIQEELNIQFQFWNCSIWNEEQYKDNYRIFRRNRGVPNKPLVTRGQLPSFPEAFIDYTMEDKVLLELYLPKLERSHVYISGFPYAAQIAPEVLQQTIQQICFAPDESLYSYLRVSEGSLKTSSRMIRDSVVKLDVPAAPYGSFTYLFSCALALGLLSYRQVYYSTLRYETERNGGRFPFSGLSTATSQSAAITSEGADYSFQVQYHAVNKKLNGVLRYKKFWRWRGILTDYLEVIPTPSSNFSGSILMVHGFGAFGEHWRDNLGPLSEAGYQVFAPTLPGYGRSHKPPIQYTTDFWIEFLRDFTAEIINDKVIIVGNSIGGYLASMFSANYPQVTKGVILINSAGKLVHNYNEYRDAKKMEEIVSGQDRGPPRCLVVAFGSGLFTILEATIMKTLRSLYPTNPDRADETLADNIYRSACDIGAKGVFLSVFYLAPPKPLNVLLLQYGGPVVVLQGILDPLNDAKSRAEELSNLCSNVDVQLLQAGHCSHDELPSIVNKKLLEFLQRIKRKNQEGETYTRTQNESFSN